VTEAVKKTASGAILFDRQIISEIGDDRFESAGWLHAEAVAGALAWGGRGQSVYVGNVPRQFVLRHFVRGGVIGKVIRDSYLWTGEVETRSFAEWRMLAKMADKGLRVPRPAAARYRRHGLTYTADIITVRIPGVESLWEYIAREPRKAEFWESVGRSVQEFHANGVYHADMNAHNLQIDKDGDLWMLDFDRGRFLPAGPWQQKTLSRLHRSLQKIAANDPGLHFGDENWEQLIAGYFSASRSA
jgi:3-deoxy-D-manno-octulosonic acid kinase